MTEESVFVQRHARRSYRQTRLRGETRGGTTAARRTITRSRSLDSLLAAFRRRLAAPFQTPTSFRRILLSPSQPYPIALAVDIQSYAASAFRLDLVAFVPGVSTRPASRPCPRSLCRLWWCCHWNCLAMTMRESIPGSLRRPGR